MSWAYTAQEVEKLHLETGSFCNISCSGCMRNWDDNARKHINTSFMTLKNVTSWFTPTEMPSINKVIFSGQIDEPASNPEIIDIARYFLENWNLKVLGMNTNGSIRTEKFWTELGLLSRQHPEFMIEWGIDGLEDTNHIYRVGADWNKLITNAHAFINAGGRATWKFIKFNHNIHQLNQAEQLSKDIGFEKFVTIDSARPGSKDMNYEHNFAEFEQVQCRAIDDKWLYVHYDGVLNPCCYFGYSERSTDPNDNINNTTVTEYLSSSKFLHDVQSSWNTSHCNSRCTVKCKKNLKDNRNV